MENTHQDQVRSLLESVERTATPTQQTSSLFVMLRRIATDVAAVRDLLEPKKPFRGLRRYVLDLIGAEKEDWLAMSTTLDQNYLEGVIDALEDLEGVIGSEPGDLLDV